MSKWEKELDLFKEKVNDQAKRKGKRESERTKEKGSQDKERERDKIRRETNTERKRVNEWKKDGDRLYEREKERQSLLKSERGETITKRTKERLDEWG